MTNFPSSAGRSEGIPGDFVAEPRPDAFSNPPMTVRKLAETTGDNAPGHIGQIGMADAIDKHFQDMIDKPLVPRPENKI